MNDLYTAYDFTQDLSFLETYYPVLEGAARFALENMIQVDGTQGELKDYWVVAPAQSPEHWYKTNGAKISGVDIATACDTQLYLNLFHIMELAAKELEDAGLGSLTDQELLEKVKTRKEQMMPLEMFLDENGRMKEWYNEYETGETWHRHASHRVYNSARHGSNNNSTGPYRSCLTYPNPPSP